MSKPLPFSTDEARLLRAVQVEESEPEVWFDPENRDKFRLRKQAERPILAWPPLLPSHDPRGVEHSGFECWKKASDSRMGIAGSYFSFKAGCRLACHSFLEAKLLRYFEMCPMVVDIRTQYPSWERDEFMYWAARRRTMPKNSILTVDFMLTLRIPGYEGVIYHGVSGKPSALLEEPRVVRRRDKELNRLNLWGSSHEVMTELSVSNIEYVNYRRLHSFMLHTQNIETYAESARTLSYLLQRTTAKGSLDRVLSMVAKRHGWTRAFGYKLFGIAHFLGFLRWNHKFQLSHKNAMVLSEFNGVSQ